MKRLMAAVAGLYLVVLAVTPSAQQAAQGREIFRFDTFGDEQLWTDVLQMHEVLASVPPSAALKVGLKVDSEALPASIINDLKSGAVNLNDPAVTRLLLSVNAVVGVMGKVSGNTIESIGITCALCHSTVDDSVLPGVGRRLDGWANRTLNVGAILALSPTVQADSDLLAAVTSWKPGMYDPRLHAFDGDQFIELNRSTEPVVIPPAYGLRLVHWETFTGDGTISYWNAYVGVTQMGGQGSFSDPRIKNLPPITQTPDMVTPKLPALLDYQLSLQAPDPPRRSFDVVAAQRGRQLFNGPARCDTCHMPPAFTDVLRRGDRSTPFLHAPSETGMSPVYASRTVNGRYRATPLRGIWSHPPYFHDGSAPTLLAVVNHYDNVLSLGLTAAQKADLVEFLKSL